MSGAVILKFPSSPARKAAAQPAAESGSSLLVWSIAGGGRIVFEHKPPGDRWHVWQMSRGDASSSWIATDMPLADAEAAAQAGLDAIGATIIGDAT